MKSVARVFPFLIAICAAIWLARTAVPPSDKAEQMNIQAFGKLPVVYQGRVKPYDTLARNVLFQISHRQTFRDAEGTKQPAVRWLLDAICGSGVGLTHRVFRIENHQVLDILGLEPRAGYRYALDEFQKKLSELDKQADRVIRLNQSRRDVNDDQILKTWNGVHLYFRVVESHSVPKSSSTRDRVRLMAHYQRLSRFSLPHPVPPVKEGEEWKPLLLAALDVKGEDEVNPATQSLTALLRAWADDDVAAFNGELETYQGILGDRYAADVSKAGFEVMFNHFAPFYRCTVLYCCVFIFVCIGWLLSSFGRSGGATSLNRAAFWLVVVTLVAHTFAIGARMYLSGRPPVTNLYSSAVFVGWGCVILGVVLECLYKIGVGNLIAAVTGFVTLLIAHQLARTGDTLEMMRAVLDTNFWLATHVITITLGYTAAFVAGVLGILFILKGVLTKTLDADSEKAFDRMIYGVVCFALLFSFIGTVTGGLWADDSWGRFWGWDPKENGALNIVLWYALILHARLPGMVRSRGTAVLAVFGNVVTAWSWFGVNQLGVGLHAYGFMDSAAFWIFVFVGIQLALIGLGLLPRKVWRSQIQQAA